MKMIPNRNLIVQALAAAVLTASKQLTAAYAERVQSKESPNKLFRGTGLVMLDQPGLSNVPPGTVGFYVGSGRIAVGPDVSGSLCDIKNRSRPATPDEIEQAAGALSPKAVCLIAAEIGGQMCRSFVLEEKEENDEV